MDMGTSATMDMGSSSSMSMGSSSAMNMGSSHTMSMGSSSSMSMSSAATMVMDTMSSMVMSGSSMDMSMPTASSSMDMAMHSGHATSTASMDMGASSTGAMDMSSSSSSHMEMGMNSYLTRKYKDYPVLFEKLYAKHKKDAFGIFVLILAAAFVYKFLLFVSWCLEVHWFKKWNHSKKKYPGGRDSGKKGANNNANSNDDFDDFDDAITETEYTEASGEVVVLPKMPNLMYDIFAPSWREMFHDVIRILLVFTSTMIVYMLMLVVMTYVLTYVFAVITGLALSEVFFNRCKISMLRRWNIQREIRKVMNCPGAANCKCGRHPKIQPGLATSATSPVASPRDHRGSYASTNSNDTITKYQNEKEASEELENGQPQGQKPKCECVPDVNQQDRNIERELSQSARQQEQSNDMDTNLLPAEKFA